MTSEEVCTVPLRGIVEAEEQWYCTGKECKDS